MDVVGPTTVGQTARRFALYDVYHEGKFVGAFVERDDAEAYAEAWGAGRVAAPGSAPPLPRSGWRNADGDGDAAACAVCAESRKG